MTIAAVQTNLPDGRMSKWKWTGVGSTVVGSTIGDWVGFSDFADRTAFTTGTFGVGGTLTWQGSINGNTSDAVAFTLHDPGGTALASTIAVAHAVLEACEYIRPILSAGSSSILIDAYLFGRKNPV